MAATDQNRTAARATRPDVVRVDTAPEDRLVEFVSELAGVPEDRVAAVAPRLRRPPPTTADRAIGAVAEALVALRHHPIRA